MRFESCENLWKRIIRQQTNLDLNWKIHLATIFAFQLLDNQITNNSHYAPSTWSTINECKQRKSQTGFDGNRMSSLYIIQKARLVCTDCENIITQPMVYSTKLYCTLTHLLNIHRTHFICKVKVYYWICGLT